jgi:hypothetical protein
MNFVGHQCTKVPNDPLNPLAFCKVWNGEGSPSASCPMPENTNPDFCKFLVKPTQRIIPWLHGEVKVELQPTKIKKQRKSQIA